MRTNPLRRSLDQLTVRNACHEAWDAMPADGATRRHCAACARPVYDLATMTRAEAQRLLDGPSDVPPCVRFARGADGRVLTRDDRATHRSWLGRAAAVAATLGLGSLFNVGCDGRRTPLMGSPPPTTSPDAGIRGQIEMGDAAPTTAPTTAPTIAPIAGEPTFPARTMGVVARPPARSR